MVNAVGGGPRPAPAKKTEEKKEEKKPESKAPAAPQAPVEKTNTGNTGSANQDVPKDGLDPKAAFEVSQKLNIKSAGGDGKSSKVDEPDGLEVVSESVGKAFGMGQPAGNEKDAGSGKKAGTDKPAGNDEKDTKAREKAAEDLLNGLGNNDPDAKKGGKEGGQDENPLEGGAAPTSGKGKPGDTKGEDEDKKGDEKPKEKPITKDSALGYAYTNFGIFDTGAGIDGADDVFSLKDLDALKNSNVKEVADNAKMLIKENVIGELGGKDGKISKDDIDGYFEENFDFKDTYKNIKIEEDTFSKEELKTLNKHLGFMARDPDGQRLLENIDKKEGGMTLKMDPDTDAYAYVSGSTLGFSEVTDEGGFLSVLTHEMTHGAATQNGKSNDEALASVLGHRLWSRHYGDHEFTKDNGETYKFDGSTEAEETVFIEELKKRGDGKPESYDAGHGDYLRSLGFEFDFKTNVSEFKGDKPVYSDPAEEPEEEGGSLSGAMQPSTEEKPEEEEGPINDGGFFR